MSTCSHCGGIIFKGAIRAGRHKFCSQRCAEKGGVLLVEDALPAGVVDEATMAAYNGPCPLCGREGGVDIRYRHQIHSYVIRTQWHSKAMLSCRKCAGAAQAGSTLYSAALGWWGFPYGVFMTPVQLSRNLYEFAKHLHRQPSGQLRSLVRRSIAEEITLTAAFEKAPEAPPKKKHGHLPHA